MQPSTIPLIPKDQIKPDADITALLNSEGYVLNTVHSPNFTPVVTAQDVIGKHVSELYKPVPHELLTSLERACDGEAHWMAITLPTVTEVGPIDRRFVVAFLPWTSIDGKKATLTRMKLLTDDLTEALASTGHHERVARERAHYLISGDFTLDDVYIDALIDVTMRQNGFDATILLDEDGVVLDIFNMGQSSPPVEEGGNFVDFITFFDPEFKVRWLFMLEHWQHMNSIETIPLPDGTKTRVLSRIRVTKLKTPQGKRIVQIFARRLLDQD